MSLPVKVTLPVLWLSLSFAKIVNRKIPVDKARVVICSIQFSEVVTVYSTFASTLISIVPPSHPRVYSSCPIKIASSCFWITFTVSANPLSPSMKVISAERSSYPSLAAMVKT